MAADSDLALAHPADDACDIQVLVRSDSREQPDDFPLAGCRYGFSLSWETRLRSVDIDLQCVVVDSAGTIVDCAYYNNLKAVGAVTHSGDRAHRKPDDVAQALWVNAQRVPSHVDLLVLVVAAYAGGSLQDIDHCQMHVFEESEARQVALFEMERCIGGAGVIGAMFRKDGSWALRIIDMPAESGQHFMDMLPTLSEVVRKFIPGAPEKQQVAFSMDRGGVLDLPVDIGCVTVGLGWDVHEGECDIDVSAVLLDGRGRDIEAVFFGRLESAEHGISHSGDSETGGSGGDDEQIVVNLSRTGEVVQQVVFVVNIYTKSKCFDQVASPYCRVVDNASGLELCRYCLREAGGERGLIIARIAREIGNRWGFHALGIPCSGRTFKDSMPHIRRVVGVKTSSLLMGSDLSEALSLPRLSTRSSVTGASKMCVVQ